MNLRALASPLLIIGPAHTGKSELAPTALDEKLETLVFGTADPLETAFSERVALLKNHRPGHWATVEDNHAILERLTSLREGCRQILFDSLNQWVASRILASFRKYSLAQIESMVGHEAECLVAAFREQKGRRIVVVTSEISAGIAPAGDVPRLFRQMTSQVNRLFASQAAAVVLVTAGIPLVVKGGLDRR